MSCSVHNGTAGVKKTLLIVLPVSCDVGGFSSLLIDIRELA